MSTGDWDLSALVPAPTPEGVSAQVAAAEEAVASLAACRDELVSGLAAERWLELLRRYEDVLGTMQVLGAYGGLWFSADTGDPEALAYRNRIEQHLSDWHARLLFLELWWQGLDEAEAARLLPEDPDLRHYLHDLRRLREHRLDEARERLIVGKDAHGVDALLTVYTLLTSRLEFELEIDGEIRRLSRDALMSHVHAPDPDRRSAAYAELLRVFGHEAPVLGQIYVHRVLDWRDEQVRLRGVPSPVTARNLANDLPDSVVTTLLEVCEEEAASFQRYFQWKAAALARREGADGPLPDSLRRQDLYAPLGGGGERIEFTEARELVLDTLHGFTPVLGKLARRVFDENHVDAALRPGKRGGAFCATVLPSQTPWVLVNHADRPRDAAILAHEIGHAVHSLLAADHSVLTQHAVLPLAETASVFSELLLTERLLAERDDPALQRELLAAALDDIYATVQRQAGFTRFEIEAHAALDRGAAATDLDVLYLAGLRRQFGDAVAVPEEFAREWVAIPHIFHTPFYCYAYSFGQLLVLALFERYRQQGEEFVPGYLELLAAGGSAPPMQILRRAGVEAEDPEFWRGGFRIVDGMVERLAALPEP